MSIKAHRGDLWIDAVKQKIQSIADAHHCEIVAMETDKDHVHILLGYDTTDSVCNIVKTLKQETTHHLWQRFGPFLAKHYWKKKDILVRWDTLPVVSGKYPRQLSKSISKTKDDAPLRTGLLPPPKGSGRSL